MAPGVSLGASEDDRNDRNDDCVYEDDGQNSASVTPDKTELKALKALRLTNSTRDAINTENDACIVATDVSFNKYSCTDQTSLKCDDTIGDIDIGETIENIGYNDIRGVDECETDTLINRRVGEHFETDDVDDVGACDKHEEISEVEDSDSFNIVASDNSNKRTNGNENIFIETDALTNNRTHANTNGDTDDNEREKTDQDTNEELTEETTVLLGSETSVQHADNVKARDTDCDRDIEIIEEETKAPDGGWGWFIILGALILRMICGGLGRSHGLFYIKFVDRYGGSATATAFVTALAGLFRIGTGPFVSILCTRVQCRYLTLIGACLLSAGLIMTGYSPSLQFLYFSYGAVSGLDKEGYWRRNFFIPTLNPTILVLIETILMSTNNIGFGLGRAFALTPVPILLGFYFEKRRSLAFGLASAGFSLGGFCISPVVEILFQTVGFQGTYLLLGGIALNVAVCSALFRPIELHRKITQQRSKRGKSIGNTEHIIVRSIDNIQAGDDISSSTISIERVKTRPNKSKNGIKSKTTIDKTSSENGDALSNTTSGASNNKRRDIINTGAKSKCSDENVKGADKSKKKPLIAWSILKDVRFLCFCFANFLLTLPTNNLFLPALAKARGASDMQAASLLSIGAGSDTLFRVVAGFVLDMKLFRTIRPQIYSAVLVISGVISLMYPLMGSYPALVLLVLLDGLTTGLKAAQNSVVVMDILGVDKLASSQAITMSVQSTAIVIGSLVAGRLKDTSGVYDGAFYFGGCAIMLAGLVMAGGNVRKYMIDRRKKSEESLSVTEAMT